MKTITTDEIVDGHCHRRAAPVRHRHRSTRKIKSSQTEYLFYASMRSSCTHEYNSVCGTHSLGTQKKYHHILCYV